MLRIKLARFGKKSQPSYRMVINEDREKRDGKYVDALGVYAPTQNPPVLNIDVKKFDEWVKKGAEPTDTSADLYKRFKSGTPFPKKIKKPNKKHLAKAEAEAKAAVEAKAAAEVAPTAQTESVEAPSAEPVEVASTEPVEVASTESVEVKTE